MARVALTLGAMGEVVLLGRGAGHVLPAASTLHVRIVAPRVDRIAYMSQLLRLTPQEAEKQVDLRDDRRNQYLLDHFSVEASDPIHYDLVLNSSLLGEVLCADLITQVVRAKLMSVDPGNSNSNSEPI
jgi:cytidylate kinase